MPPYLNEQQRVAAVARALGYIKAEVAMGIPGEHQR